MDPKTYAKEFLNVLQTSSMNESKKLPIHGLGGKSMIDSQSNKIKPGPRKVIGQQFI